MLIIISISFCFYTILLSQASCIHFLAATLILVQTLSHFNHSYEFILLLRKDSIRASIPLRKTSCQTVHNQTQSLFLRPGITSLSCSEFFLCLPLSLFLRKLVMDIRKVAMDITIVVEQHYKKACHNYANL